MFLLSIIMHSILFRTLYGSFLLVIIAGREYDKSGVLRSWWGEESIARFKQRAQCFDDQYSAYTAYGENVISFAPFFFMRTIKVAYS